MLRKIIFFIVFLPIFSESLTAQINLPESNFFPGWEKSGKNRHFSRSNLFDYINGGAEIFHEFGFIDLVVQSYKNGDNELIVELYQMELPESALGIYLARKGKENPSKKIFSRNTVNPYQVSVLKGNYFIQINSFSGDKNLLPIIVNMVNKLIQQIRVSNDSELMHLLPGLNLVPGSEQLIRGVYSLQPIFTFGEGDILQLDGTIFGVVGDYKVENGEEYTQIVIQYSNEKKSKFVFTNLIDHFDPYHTIISKKATRFIFQDFQNKYGIVQRINEKLDIKIKLTSNPKID